MARFRCRFCTNPVRTDGAICFACRMEGRSADDPGLPMQEDQNLPPGDDVWVREQEPSQHNQYHGDSTRDDI